MSDIIKKKLILACFFRKFSGFKIISFLNIGDIAQLARAFDWQSRGQGFDSPYLHKQAKNNCPRMGVFVFVCKGIASAVFTNILSLNLKLFIKYP
jgi:hypothetical protein